MTRGQGTPNYMRWGSWDEHKVGHAVIPLVSPPLVLKCHHQWPRHLFSNWLAIKWVTNNRGRRKGAASYALIWYLKICLMETVWKQRKAWSPLVGDLCPQKIRQRSPQGWGKTRRSKRRRVGVRRQREIKQEFTLSTTGCFKIWRAPAGARDA